MPRNLETNMLTLICAFVVVAPTAHLQSPVLIQRKFSEGEKNTYATKLSLTTSIGDVDVQMKVEQRVLKVLAEGAAEVESELLTVKTLVNGDEMPNLKEPDSRKMTFRLGRNGMPAGTGEGKGFGFNFLHFAGLLADRPLAIGETADIKYVDPSSPKQSAVGKVKLESILDGQAKLVSNWVLELPPNPKPLKVDMTSWVDLKTGRLEKASGAITGAPSQVEFTAIQFSTERVKS